jgi:hypothetical protein
MAKSVQQSIIEAVVTPAAGWMEVRYLKLRNAWERYAIRHKAQFTEHSMMDVMFLQSEAERDEMGSPEHQALMRETLSKMKKDGGKFLPVARVTIEYRGYTIRAQSMVEWLTGVMCHVKVNVRGTETWGFKVNRNPSLGTKAAFGALSAFGSVALKMGAKSAIDEAAMKQKGKDFQSRADRLRKAVVEKITSGDAEFDRNYELHASRNLREYFSAPHVVSAITKVEKLSLLSGWGSPDAPESSHGNRICFDFVSALDAERLEHAVELAKMLIDDLSARDWILPPTVDEVAD